MEIFVVRHAEDRAAAGRRFGDEGLTPRGEAQVRTLSERLAPVRFAGVECSPFVRARETAAGLIRDPSIPLREDPDLAEGSAGALLGLSIDEARRRYPEYFRLGHTVVARLAATGRTAPGGESRETFLTRARRVSAHWRKLLAAPGDPILVVSHGGLLNYALQDLTGVRPRDEVPFGFENAGVARLLSFAESPAFGPFPMVLFGSVPGGPPSAAGTESG